MTKLARSIGIALALIAIASCGGGGGGPTTDRIGTEPPGTGAEPPGTGGTPSAPERPALADMPGLAAMALTRSGQAPITDLDYRLHVGPDIAPNTAVLDELGATSPIGLYHGRVRDLNAARTLVAYMDSRVDGIAARLLDNASRTASSSVRPSRSGSPVCALAAGARQAIPKTARRAALWPLRPARRTRARSAVRPPPGHAGASDTMFPVGMQEGGRNRRRTTDASASGFKTPGLRRPATHRGRAPLRATRR